jgi:hypothetical protein
MAGICLFNNSNPGEIFSSDDGNGSAGYRLEQFAGQFIVTIPGVGNFFPTPAFSPVVGRQYFVAASRINGLGFSYVYTDLTTGQIFATVDSSASTSNPSTSGNFVIGNMTGGTNPGGKIAAVMYSSSPMSLAALTQWAADPWSFWYPRKLDLSMMLKAPAGGINAFSLSGAYGVFSISVQIAAMNAAHKLAGAEGLFTISGQAATELRGIKLAGAEGAFVINGGVATPTVGMGGSEGAFTISGQASKFAVALSMKGAEGAFVINGGGAVMAFTPFGTAVIPHSNPFFATPGPGKSLP